MVYFAFALFFGVLFASVVFPSIPIILCSLFLVLSLMFLNRKNKTNFKAAIAVLFFVIGVLDYSLIFGIESRLDIFDGKKAAYECLIIDSSTEKGSYVQYTAKSIRAVSGGRYYNFSEKVFLRINKETKFKFGDIIAFEGECSDISQARNPGGFNYRLYYKNRGINKVIKSDRGVLIRENSAGLFRTMLYISREKVRQTIRNALPEEEAAILVGIITGDKTDIDEYTRDAYMKTGLSHILSVSGLHVGFLMLLLTYVLMPFKLEKKLQGFIILLAVTYYVLLIGAPLPSLRALIMLAVLTAGKGLRRKYDLISSASFAGILILLFKPLAIHDPGFMISFGAIFSIAILYKPFYDMLKHIPPAIRGAAALSLASWLGLSPVLVYYFNYISVISIFTNIIAIPLSLIITIVSFTGVFTGIVSNILALYIFSVDYYAIGLFNFLIRKASELPLSGFHIPTLPFHFYFLYYGGVALWVAFTKINYIRVYIRRFELAYILSVVVAISVYNLPAKELKMVFFDVGQGDSCCITTPNRRTVLIDGGGSSQKGDYYYDIGGKITLPALMHQGIWRIDTIIVSHLHDDHIEGLLKVMEVYTAKNLILPKVSGSADNVSGHGDAILDICNKKGIKVYKLGKGDYIDLGSGISIDFIFPGGEASSDENENSLVGILNYKSFYALFTGDIGKDAELALAGRIPKSDVLKVPHHGSGRSSSKEFLKAVQPRVSVISVGRNNYGHPSAETLERLNECGSLVYRTDENGAVIVTTNGESMKVKVVAH